jgi:hypothetical protein
MFGLFKKKAKPLTEKEQAAENVRAIEAEYWAMINPVPPAPEQTEAERQMEIYFTVKNDILRYNISRTGGVPTEGNDFD